MIDKIKELREKSKKRKFKQTFDLIVNIKGLDLKKPENRINSDFILPSGRGKIPKIVLFSDTLTAKAKGNVDLIIDKNEIAGLVKNKKKFKKIANDYEFFFGEAPLMPQIGKAFGTVLGPRGKVPKPVPPQADVKAFTEGAKKAVRIVLKENPVIHVPVGTEEMPDEDIKKNIEAVLNFVKDKLPKGRSNIKNVYLKLTMSKPVKLEMI